MKTQEEYAHEIDEIVRRDVESCQGDWFNIDKEIFMQPENKNKAFILGTRKTGCDLIMLGGTNCNEGSMDKCPECGENGTLRWVDKERQEMDAKDLDCLGYVRELRIDDYLSPTTLEEIAEEIKKKVNRG